MVGGRDRSDLGALAVHSCGAGCACGHGRLALLPPCCMLEASSTAATTVTGVATHVGLCSHPLCSWWRSRTRTALCSRWLHSWMPPRYKAWIAACRPLYAAPCSTLCCTALAPGSMAFDCASTLQRRGALLHPGCASVVNQLCLYCPSLQVVDPQQLAPIYPEEAAGAAGAAAAEAASPQQGLPTSGVQMRHSCGWASGAAGVAALAISLAVLL